MGKGKKVRMVPMGGKAVKALGAYLGERKQLTIAHSTDVLFKNYQTAIMGVERLDINCFGCGDENTVEAIVGLLTGSP